MFSLTNHELRMPQVALILSNMGELSTTLRRWGFYLDDIHPKIIGRSVCGQLEADTLNEIAGHIAFRAVVEFCGSRVGMSGEVLNVFDGNALGYQVSQGSDAKGVS